jgi:hypothetical protein
VPGISLVCDSCGSAAAKCSACCRFSLPAPAWRRKDAWLVEIGSLFRSQASEKAVAWSLCRSGEVLLLQ